MLLAGDEIGRTQRGNNNAYCQDNEVSWLDWEHADAALLSFVRQLAEFRSRHPVFHRRHWFQGRPLHGAGVKDIAWFSPEGSEMSDADWQVSFAKAVAVFLNGESVPVGGGLQPRSDASFLLLLNAFWEPIEFVVPQANLGTEWVPVLDTAAETDPFCSHTGEVIVSGNPRKVEGRSVVVLQRVEARPD